MPPPQQVRRIPQTNAHLDVITRQLVDRLRQLSNNDSVSYVELMQETGIPTMPLLVARLRTARKYLRRISKQLFDLIPGERVVCLTESDKLGFVARNRRQIHTRATNNVENSQAVDSVQLTQTEKYCLLAELSANAAVAMATEEKMIRAIAAHRHPQPLQIDPHAIKEQYKDIFKGF